MLPPLLFQPILKNKVWGGRRLEALGKRLPPGALVGESWEVADLPHDVPDGRSIIMNGPLARRTLREALDAHEREILGHAKRSPEAGFPLLIKYLDARENLSVQVHPDAAYAARHPGAHLKSEAWVVIAAEPGAVIFKGVRPHVTREAFAQHIASGEVLDDLIAVPVKPGDCHYLPSGTCHALGAGILVAEVQTPSDTTFRVYDWGRQGSRALHVEQALECIAFGRAVPEPRPSHPVCVAGMATTNLVRTDFFEIERIDIASAATLPVITADQPVVWMVIAGGGKIQCSGGEAVDLPTGSTALMPASLRAASARLTAPTSLLRITLPSPARHMIA
jgi:mannose-6-phosphate isomerase